MTGMAPAERLAMVPVFPILETERLVLRELTEADAGWYLTHFSRPEIVHGSGFPAPTDEEAARRELERYVLGLFRQREGMRWGLVPRGTEVLVGTAGLHRWRDEPVPQAEIGYDLAPEWWGQGIMQEALRPILGYASSTLGLRRIEAIVLTHNERSCRTLERAGFVREGLLRGHGEDEHGAPHDEFLYSRHLPG